MLYPPESQLSTDRPVPVHKWKVKPNDRRFQMTVVSEPFYRDGYQYAIFLCDCGKYVARRTQSLSKTCGCLQRAILVRRNTKYPVIDGKRQCASCLLTFSIEQFNSHRKTSQQVCRQCQRWRHIKNKYGLSPDQYKSLAAGQNHCCGCCSKPADQCRLTNGVWDIDHCHSTGVIRGLLCKDCNAMLGFGQDDPLVLEAGARYLRLRIRGVPETPSS